MLSVASCCAQLRSADSDTGVWGAVVANKPSLNYAEGFPYVYKTGLKRGQVLRVHLMLAGLEFGEHLRSTPPIERPSAFVEKYLAGSAVRGHCFEDCPCNCVPDPM